MMYELLVPAIAEHLPGQWQANNDDEAKVTNTNWTLTNGPVSFSVMARRYGEPGRLIVSCDANRQSRITVSETRSAQAIAKDITRRFLPDCIKNHREAAEYQRKNNAERNARQDTVERLSFASGGDLSAGRYQPHETYEIELSGSWTYEQPHARAKVRTAAVELEFCNLPPAAAEKLVTLFYTLCPPPAKTESEAE